MTKKIIFVVLLIGLVTVATAQTTLPAFTPQAVTLAIPAYLPGIMDDSAFIRNDTLTYMLTGQFFGKGFKIPLNKPSSTLASPWETLVEMADAYAMKNTSRIISLYTSGSKAQISKVLTGQQSLKFLDFVSKASKANLRILGGMEYKNGFMAFLKDDLYGVHQNFLIKENGRYKLSALEDKAPTAWNIALYFKFEPKPLIPLANIPIPDSLALSSTTDLNITLTEPGDWVAVHTNEVGYPVLMLVQDNGMNDRNPAPLKISYPFKASAFVNAGEYTYYVSSFNYPVQKVAKSIIVEEARHTIKIY